MTDAKKRNLKRALRDHGNAEVNKAVVDFVNETEKYLSDLELDAMRSHFAIRTLRFELNLMLDAMTAYGIDVGKLGSYQKLMSDIDLSRCGIYKRPEKWN